MNSEDRTSPGDVTRRRFIAGTTALMAGAATVGLATRRALAANVQVPVVPLGRQPAGLPARQHAWTQWLHRDSYGNAEAPKFDRLLFFDVRGYPSPAYARLFESRLRALERRFAWGPDGLLFTVSYGPSYFRLLRIPSPVPVATSLASFEHPAIDRYDICVHLASDNEQRLADIEAALVRGQVLSGVEESLSLGSILVWRETRTGFSGAGIPRAHEHVHGIPAGRPVPKGSPLFMGFKSGLTKNQATEDDVTIHSGAFAEGTTMQVSHMRLELDGWYGKLSAQDRVARMYSPQTTIAAAKRFTTDASGNPNQITQAITRYGVIGHAQASAQARRNNRPVIIRRDFDTVDGGQAGLHFVSVQQSIQDFVATRNAMNATGAHNVNPKIGAQRNNGINAFIDVKRRANYIMPSRAQRSFPLLPTV